MEYEDKEELPALPIHPHLQVTVNVHNANVEVIWEMKAQLMSLVQSRPRTRQPDVQGHDKIDRNWKQDSKNNSDELDISTNMDVIEYVHGTSQA